MDQQRSLGGIQPHHITIKDRLSCPPYSEFFNSRKTTIAPLKIDIRLKIIVASTIITLSTPTLLNTFAIGLTGEDGTWVFKQILHSASSSSDTDKIR